MMKEMMDYIKNREDITKQEIYLKFSRRHADYFWKFLHFMNDSINSINKEIEEVDEEIKSLFSFQKIKDKSSSQKVWQVRRNYTINTFQIDDISGFEVVLR